MTVLSRAIREGYPPGPERERWLRWLTRVASKDAAARHGRSKLTSHARAPAAEGFFLGPYLATFGSLTRPLVPSMPIESLAAGVASSAAIPICEWRASPSMPMSC